MREEFHHDGAVKEFITGLKDLRGPRGTDQVLHPVPLAQQR